MSQERPTTSRPGLVVPLRTARAGSDGPTKDQARGPHYRRTTRGLYVPSAVSDDDVEQRILEASMVVPPGGAVTGWAALTWRGARWFDGLGPDRRRMPVTIVISTRDIRVQPGIELSGEGLNPALVERVDGVPVTVATYAVSYLMRYSRSLREAVTAFDLAAYSDLVSIEEMAAFLATQNGWTGVPRARAALPHLDENAWSPLEPPLRTTWPEPGRVRLLTNRPVFGPGGRHLGTPDVIDPVTGVYGEYDGDAHLERRQRDHDLRREGDLAAHGLEGVTMIAPDLADPTAFLRRVALAYHRASLRPPEERRWTLSAPDWWVPTHTVALRRALSADQRRRFLAYRTPS